MRIIFWKYLIPISGVLSTSIFLTSCLSDIPIINTPSPQSQGVNIHVEDNTQNGQTSLSWTTPTNAIASVSYRVIIIPNDIREPDSTTTPTDVQVEYFQTQQQQLEVASSRINDSTIYVESLDAHGHSSFSQLGYQE